MKSIIKGLIGTIALISAIIIGVVILRLNNPLWLWYLARASGIGSYLMLFLLTMTGLGITSGFIYNIFGPVFSWRMHRAYGISLVAFVLIHLITLAYDTTMNFSLAEILIPFYSKFQPLYLAMGIIGLYLFIFIIVTSLIWVVKKYKPWRMVHYLAFPAFILLFLHGVLIGTDSKHPVMIGIYWTTGILVALGIIYRIKKALQSK